MTFIPDGSKTDYDKEKICNRYSWGWLGKEVPADKLGWKDLALKDKIVQMLWERRETHSVLHHMGFHGCGICDYSQEEEERQCWCQGSKGLQWPWNGSYVIEYKGKSLRAPAAVGHYIEIHNYKPDDFVIKAILNGVFLDRATEQAQQDKEWDEHLEQMRLEDEERERNKTPEERAREAEMKRYEEYVTSVRKRLKENGAFIG